MDSSTASSAGDYEVFLSFRGVDTRQGFTAVLYEYMTMAEIRVFKDDDELAIGDKIDSILLGLASSKICIPIFSPKFAESKWCLREVAEMVDLKKTIVPVFYKVSPHDVKLKQGSIYWNDLRKLEENQCGNHEEEMEKWKNALKEAGSTKGKELGDKSYTKFCKELVDEVLSKLGPRKRLEIDHFIGDANKTTAMKLLDMGSSEEVVYVGIHGMGGIGKTTITKLIYNQFLSNFDYCGFVPDIREFSAINGIKGLPRYLYDNLQPKLVTHSKQSEPIVYWFKNKKVLLILDDVDSYEQIREIARESSWFGLGSRIILTTRDKKVLEDYAEESRTEIRYLEMEELDSVQSLELFSKCAFGKDSPPSAYQNLSERAITCAGGLPLAITVMAKYLRNKKEAVWEEIIKRLKKTPPKEVKDKLLISYNALEEEQKRIFLDIACFFIYYNCTESSHVFYMWEDCGLCPRWSLEVLQSMSLVKLDKYDRLMMHDQLRDLGRDIVRTKSGGDLTKQTRLWEISEIEEVVKSKKKQKNNIEALQLVSWKDHYNQYLIDEGLTSFDEYHNSNFTSEELTSFDNIMRRVGFGCLCKGANTHFIDEEFKSFDMLRYLELSCWSKLQGNFSNLLPQLRWLKCSNIVEARNLVPSNLVILDLRASDIDENWDSWSEIQTLKKLKVLNLSGSRITGTPVFSGNMALERLLLAYCTELTYIDPSIGKLNHLNYLSFVGCDNVKNLPESLGELHALREFHLENTGITSLPNSIRRLQKLESLNLCGSKIRLLPESFDDLKSLVDLDISHSHIAALPSTINRLPLLQTFKLDCCCELHELPVLPSSLKDVKINSVFLKKLSDLSNLQDVTSLELIGGSSILYWNGLFPRKLQYLTIKLFCISRLPDLSSCPQLSYLKLSCERSLKVLPNMSGLRKLLALELESCEELVEIPGIGKLQCLTSLFIRKCSSLVCLENLRELQQLEEFNVVDCQKLIDFPGLGELQALTKVCVQFCGSLEKFVDLTAVKGLKEVSLVGCWQLAEFPGLENLKSLTKLEVLFIPSLDILKKLTHLKNIGVPGTYWYIKSFDFSTGEVPGHGELDVLPNEMSQSSDQSENLSGEAEGYWGLYYLLDQTSCTEQENLPAAQSEAVNFSQRKSNIDQFISSEEERYNMWLSGVRLGI